jgi:hypothetical protein
VITPDPQTGHGVPHRFARVRLFDAVTTAATRESKVFNTEGYEKLWLFLKPSGFVAGTDFVGSLELLFGCTETAIADLAAMVVAAANSFTVLPTGFTIDSPADAYAIAGTFESNALIVLHFDKCPPRLAARLTRGSGGSAGAFTLDAYLQ